MDLSGLKWPAIIVLVVFVIWLGTSGGVSFMVNNFTKAVPGESESRDKTDEAGLSRVGTFLLATFRYDWAIEVFETSMERYGESGANYWYNVFQRTWCYEHLEDYRTSYNILQELIAVNANSLDSRIPVNDALILRANKLKEVHML